MTDIEEIWFEEGIEKGIEKGIERGIEKGRQEGEWIGKVELLESLLGKEPTPLSVLQNESVKQLRIRFQRLEREYHKKHRS